MGFETLGSEILVYFALHFIHFSTIPEPEVTQAAHNIIGAFNSAQHVSFVGHLKVIHLLSDDSLQVFSHSVSTNGNRNSTELESKSGLGAITLRMFAFALKQHPLIYIGRRSATFKRLHRLILTCLMLS